MSIPPAETSSEPSFSLGMDGTDECPTGSVSVDTASECESAASALNLAYIYQLYPAASDHPKGCFTGMPQRGYYNIGEEAFFNPHATGAAKARSAPICVTTA